MAGFSFLSPVSVVTAPSQPYFPLAKVGRTNGSFRCRCKMEESEVTNRVQEKQLNRRDIFRCFTTVACLEMVAGSGSQIQNAIAADLIQRRQRSEFQANIKEILSDAIKGHLELIPSILRLALNDAVTYDKTGGPNGSIRLSQEISRPENTGLSPALDLLVKAKEEIDSYSKGGPISYSDLIQFAAEAAVKKTFLASAIRKCGGNEEKGRLLYSAYGSNGQWGLFDRQFGRTDSQNSDPEGRVPQWDKASVQEMKNKFSNIGFGPRQELFTTAGRGSLSALLFTIIPWSIWYQRNLHRHEGAPFNLDAITHRIKTKIWTINQAKLLKPNKYDSAALLEYFQISYQLIKQPTLSIITWKLPDTNWTKCNVDAAFKTGFNKVAAILRNHHGGFLKSQTIYISALSPLHAEFQAFELGVDMCLQLNLNGIWLESDSLLVINILSHGNPFPAHCLHVIRSIQNKMKHIDHRISFIHREGNGIAHWLAQSQLQGQIDYHMLPPKLQGQIIMEALGIPHIRKK